jgi:DNA-binding NtrC family response regulator
MRQVVQMAPKVAATDAAVLICGEAGVGKASLAREIHRLSRRAKGPLVRVACGALREGELEATLLAAPGGPSVSCPSSPATLLQSASRGTLFLDGIERLPYWAQVQLLERLQPEAAEPGSDALAPVAFRVIASLAGDAEAALAKEAIYPELYYYLGVVQLYVPPLRHRLEDIRGLAECFLAAAISIRCLPAGGTGWHFSPDSWDCLLHYDWPGNVPQLASVVAQAVVLADGAEIGPGCVLQSLGKSRQSYDSQSIALPLTGGLKEMERFIIGDVIQRCGGNKAAAARTLGLHRRTLYRILAADSGDLSSADSDALSSADSDALR